MVVILDRPTALPSDWTAEEWDALVAALTRRKLLGGGLALGALSVLAACGTSAAPTATVPTTRMVDTAKGRVQVPANPQRVVCVDGRAAADVLELGLTPVGVYEKLERALPFAFLAGYPAIAKVGVANTGPDLEKVAALKPDLILGVDNQTTPYDKLTAIAPTALFAAPTAADWPQLAEQYATTLGRGEQLATLKKRYQDRAAAIRTTYAATLDKTRWDIAFNAGGGNWWLYYPTSQPGLVLAAAGVRFGSASADKTGNFETLSYERFDLLRDTDVIVVYGNGGQPDSFQQEMLDSPAFKTTKASSQGQVYGLDRLFPLSYQSALDLLDEVEGVLKKL